MVDSADSIPNAGWSIIGILSSVPIFAWAIVALAAVFGILILLYISLLLLSPTPRPARKSEKQFVSIQADGQISPFKPLPCWHDSYEGLKEMAKNGKISPDDVHQAPKAELFMSVVVPAYNEQLRLSGMLEEAVAYLQQEYAHHGTRSRSSNDGNLQASGEQSDPRRGWEIIIVDDGSSDRTIAVALKFARDHQLGLDVPPAKGPWIKHPKMTRIPPGSIRVVKLEQNRGKGGAVVHGMRHARGSYVVFADADGASKFSDLGLLVRACEKVKDKRGRAVGVASRAHMVGTEAVVQRSPLRNMLMYTFHFLLWVLTTKKTAQIKDTQCGFKLFTRASLPYIIPYMHSDGWIFDVEMLMLAESANIPMVEVPIGWKEISGSKLNVVSASLDMAFGLALLRLAWGLGIYKR